MFSTYFSARYILSKKALFNNVLSDRSDGKTFDCKNRTLDDYKNNKDITIYMRRYKTEIPKSLYENFFNDIINTKGFEEYKEWQFKGSRTGVQVHTPDMPEGKWDWIVFFVPLSMSGKFKSVLDPFHKRIHIIDFDEYVPLDKRYLPDEMQLLIEFWKSIDRDRFTTQLIVLGNKITAFNPFLDYFKLDLAITGEKIRLYKNNTLAVQIYANKEHRQVRKESKFYDLIAGTPYEEYDNGGILESLNIKVASTVGMKYMCSFRSCLGEGSIWTNGTEFCVSTAKRKDGYVLVDQMYSDIDRENYSITFGRFGQLFRRVIGSGRFCAEDDKAFHMFEPLMRKIWK